LVIHGIKLLRFLLMGRIAGYPIYFLWVSLFIEW